MELIENYYISCLIPRKNRVNQVTGNQMNNLEWHTLFFAIFHSRELSKTVNCTFTAPSLLLCSQRIYNNQYRNNGTVLGKMILNSSCGFGSIEEPECARGNRAIKQWYKSYLQHTPGKVVLAVRLVWVRKRS